MPDQSPTHDRPGGGPAVVSDRAALWCARCGYDLRGLSREAKCPECGTPLVQSLYGDYLRHQQPAWLAKLLRGAGVSLAAQAGWLALTGYALAVNGTYDWSTLVSQGPLARIVPFVLLVINLVAAVWLTAPEPERVELVFSSRHLVRIGVAVLTVAGVAGYLPELREPPLLPFWLTFGTINFITTVAWGVYLGGLAVRIPSPGVAAGIVIATIAVALLEAVLYVYPWVAYVIWVKLNVPLRTAPAYPLQLAVWVIGLYTLYLTACLYRALAVALGSAAVGASASNSAGGATGA